MTNDIKAALAAVRQDANNPIARSSVRRYGAGFERSTGRGAGRTCTRRDTSAHRGCDQSLARDPLGGVGEVVRGAAGRIFDDLGTRLQPLFGAGRSLRRVRNALRPPHHTMMADAR
jgi:hypothetical protein